MLFTFYSFAISTFYITSTCIIYTSALVKPVVYSDTSKTKSAQFECSPMSGIRIYCTSGPRPLNLALHDLHDGTLTTIAKWQPSSPAK